MLHRNCIRYKEWEKTIPHKMHKNSTLFFILPESAKALPAHRRPILLRRLPARRFFLSPLLDCSPPPLWVHHLVGSCVLFQYPGLCLLVRCPIFPRLGNLAQTVPYTLRVRGNQISRRSQG